MSDDSLFREVEEELRRERLGKIWKKYGTAILLGAATIVFIVAGYQFWNWWQLKQASEAGQRYSAAVRLISQNKRDEAAKALQKLTAEAPRGYAMLARLRLAANEAARGNIDAAVAAYDALAAQSGADPMLKGFARIQAAMLRLDKADRSEIKKRVEDMTGPTDSWRHSAREIIALAAYKAGDFAKAETMYNEIIVDAAVPASLRERANKMLSLIVAALAEQAGTGAAIGGKTGMKPEEKVAPGN